jgi:hypothetical protein
MNRVPKVGVLLLTLSAAVPLLLELNHFDRYGHLVGLGLHADAVVSKVTLDMRASPNCTKRG